MALPSFLLTALTVAIGAILLSAAPTTDATQLCDVVGQPDDLVRKLCELRVAAQQLANDLNSILLDTELTSEAQNLQESPEKRKNEFMRFGKRKNEFMRFGKRKNEFMRFGKRDEEILKGIEGAEH